MEKAQNQFINAVEILKNNGTISSKNELAEHLGLSKTGLSEILNGRNKLSLSITTNFCKIFNINLYWLFYGEGEMFNDNMPDKKPNKESLEYRVEKLENLLEKQVFAV